MTFLKDKLVIAVDFDGTITTQPDMGQELVVRDHCKEVLQRLHNDGHKLILWTCRTGTALKQALYFLSKHGLLELFDTINEQLPEIIEKYAPEVAAKVGADIYIDDKGIFMQEIDWKRIEAYIYGHTYPVSDDDTFFDRDARSPQLEELGYSMVGWLDGLASRPDNSKLYEIVALLLAIQYDKEGSYGSSWKGKGEYRGIMANLDRKYDRLDTITNDEIAGRRKPLPTVKYEELSGAQAQDIGESKIDALADLANYCLLYLSYMKEQYPGAFRFWVTRNVPAYLREKIPFITK